MTGIELNKSDKPSIIIIIIIELNTLEYYRLVVAGRQAARSAAFRWRFLEFSNLCSDQVLQTITENAGMSA